MAKETKGTVLVVDDEAANLGVLFEFLRDAGFRVLVAENGHRALETVARVRPEILLLDIKLPDIDGYEVYRKLQERELTQGMTVIFLSVLAETEDIVRGFDLNAVDYITKPFQPQEVVARVQKHLVLHDLRRQLERQNIQLQQEVAERKQAEEDGKDANRILRTTLNGMLDPVMLIDPDYQVVWANNATYDNYTSGQQIEPFLCYQIFHNQDQPCREETSECPLALVAETLQPVTVLHEHTRIDGEIRYLEIVATPLVDAEGNFNGIIEASRDITDRVQAEKDLRRSEAKFRQFFEHEPAYCYMVSTEGIILDVNRAALSALGYQKDELVGKPLRSLYAPKCLAKVEILFSTWLGGGELSNEELVVLTKDGVERTVLLSVDAMRDENGEILHSISVQIDITERKQIEADLLKNERSLAKAQQVAGVGHYEWDLKANSVSWSDELYRIFGVDKAAFSPTVEGFADFLHPDDLYKISPDNMEKLINLETHEIEFRIVDRTTQGIKHIHLWGETTYDPGGKPAHIIGTIQDISERISTMEALKEKTTYLNSIMSSATEDAIITTDLDFRVTYFNPVAEKIYGITAEQSIGKKITDVCPLEIPDDSKAQGLEEMRIQGVHQYHMELEVDGELRSFRQHLSGINDQDDELIGYARFSRDITERLRAEEALRELSVMEERRRLARNLHDSMTQSIQSLALTAQSARNMVEKERHSLLPASLDILVDGAEHAHKELRLLLHELQVVPDEQTDLLEILRTRLENVEQRVGVETHFYVEGRGALAKATEIEVYYIAQEALNNALRHADANQISISIQVTPAYLELQVSDNGCGFPSPLTGRIDLNKIQNYGMGLPNMVARTEKLAGVLGIESSPGDGTIVRLVVEM